MKNDRAPSVLFVVGLPHSGARELTQTLANAGAALARDASRDRIDFGTPNGIARLNAKMLDSIGASLANPGPLIVSGESLARVRGDLTKRLLKSRGKRAAARLEQALTPETTTVICDPQIALLLPFWRSVIASTGIDARFAYVHRNPLARADISRQQSQQPVRRGWFLWQYLTIEILEAAPETKVVKATDLMRDPATVARSLLPDAKPPQGANHVPVLEEHPRDSDTLEDVPLFARQARDLHALLERWPDATVADRTAAVADLRARFDDAMLVGGMGRPSKQIEITLEPEETVGPTRPLILHYHLFKNAGSSIDAMLRKNFGDRWTEHEFARKGRDANRGALIDFLEEHQAIDAFSSHTMLLPLPSVNGRSIIPIIFVRHPLLRMRSAYGFERRQDADTKGARLAKERDFTGYVAALLEEPRNRQARNFQTVRFAFGTPGSPTHEFERAMTTLASLPFVGLVEQYDRSVARLCDLVKPAFPAFEPLIVRRNAESPADTRTIDERITQVRAELGETMYEALVEANRDDIRLFEHVCTLYPGDTD